MNNDIKKLELELNLLRSKIDKIDVQLKSLLKERFDLVENIIKIKKLLGADYFDLEREYNIYEMVMKDLPLDKIKPIQNIFEKILDESRSLQRNKINQKTSTDDTKEK